MVRLSIDSYTPKYDGPRRSGGVMPTHIVVVTMRPHPVWGYKGEGPMEQFAGEPGRPRVVRGSDDCAWGGKYDEALEVARWYQQREDVEDARAMGMDSKWCRLNGRGKYRIFNFGPSIYHPLGPPGWREE